MGIKIVVVFFACACSLLAQPAGFPQPPKAHVDAMKKLSFLVGKWKGPAWSEMVPGRRVEMVQTEDVQYKLEGIGLLVEGIGKAKFDGKEVVGHSAVGMVTYDETAGTYKMRTFHFLGRGLEMELKLVDKGFEWGHKAGPMEIRYKMTLTPDDRWLEIGEMSTDGKSWRKFVELNLERVK